MQNLLLFLIRYGHFLTFLFLESICLYLLVQHNEQQQEIFLYSSNLFAGKISDNFTAIESYLHLNDSNDSLAAANAQLINQFYSSKDIEASDSSELKYRVLAARVINNQISGRNNMVTLDKGRKHGVEKSMGIIHPSGVVGIITQVSSSYSTGVSLLNTETKVSAKIKRNNYFGSLTWDTQDPRFVQLSAIPKHADVRLGDTIVTTSYSTIFPPSHPVGIISDIKQPVGRGDFLLSIRLFLDLSQIERVYLIASKDREEIIQLQNQEQE